MSKRVETIQIQGMSRHVNEINAKQGTTQELINAKPWNGAIVPVQSKIKSYNSSLPQRTIDVLKNITTHVVEESDGSTGRYYFAYEGGSGRRIVRWNSTGGGLSFIMNLNTDESFVGIATLNNIVVISTTERKVYLVFMDGAYKSLPPLELPDVFFYVDQKEVTLAGEETPSEMAGEIAKRIEEELSNKYAQGYCFLRLAFRLYDNTYIYHSDPLFIQLFAPATYQTSGYFTEDTTGSKLVMGESPKFDRSNGDTNLYFYKLLYKVSNDLATTFEAWKGIIKSLDIFVSNIINPYDFSFSNIESWDSGFSWTPFRYNDTHDTPVSNVKDDVIDIDDLFENVNNFYKADEISIEKLSEGELTEEYEVNLTKTMTAKETLDIDNYTRHVIAGRESINYNSRIHYANLVTALAAPYSSTNRFRYSEAYQSTAKPAPGFPSGSDWSGIYEIHIQFKINTFDGDKYVSENITDKLYMSENTLSSTPVVRFMFDSIVSYPDSRAKEAKIYLKIISGPFAGLWLLVDTLELKTHPFRNLAYYINKDMNRFMNEYILGEPISEGYNWPAPFYYVLYEDTSETTSLYEAVTGMEANNRTITDKNRIQLSELDNPFIYPAENSYQIGTQADEITAIGTSMEAISEGQYGMFPLYVFTKQGIWLMEQGSSGTQYSNIVPVSRVRARGNIAQTMTGIAFVSAEGVHIISGREVVNVSKTLRNFDYDFSLAGGYDYDDILTDAQLSDLVDASTFLDYLDGDISLAYDTVEEELHVCNSTKEYSYVFQMNSGSWYKSDLVFKHVVDNQPGYLVTVGTSFYDIEQRDDTVLWKDVFIQTNPLTLNSMWRKKLTKIFLRCNIQNYAGEGMKIHVLASNNLYDWNKVNGVVDYDGQIHDMKIKRLRASYKYFVFIIEGNIKVNHSDITALQLEVEDRFTNKLR